MKIFCRCLFIVFVALFASPVSAQVKIPELEQRVSDFTNTLSFQEWKSLEQMLKSFEDSTSTQIAVLMIGSLDGESIEDYASKVFEGNKIGQAHKDNGVLLVVAKDDRKMKIEVGYGLEGVLTDALSSEIIRNDIAPHFRDGNYFAGLVTGLDAMMRATAGEYQAEDRGKNAPVVSTTLGVLALGFIFFFLLPMMAARRRYIVGSGGHRYFSGWGYGGWPGSFGGGGSSFRGGGSSFGGFGGGMSGGGGATGSW
jgi:uncharacterized protein